MNDWLTFTKRERLGILGWAILSILILCAPYFYRSFIQKNRNFENQYSSEIIEFEQEIKKQEEEIAARRNKYSKTKQAKKTIPKTKTPSTITSLDTIAYFSFDPNTASKEDLIKLGFSTKVSNTLLKFRSKGGKFFQKEDLKMIYGLDEKFYRKLESYVNIKKKFKPKKKFVSNSNDSNDNEAISSSPEFIKPKPKAKPKVDINTATIEEFDKLYGIGPTLSKRIDRYRNSLGGFYDINQIAEVYNLPDSTFQNIKDRLKFTSIIEKRDINKLDIPQLAAHPYLTKKQAGKLITHRDHEKSIKNWEELQTILKITPNEVDRLKEYFLIRSE